MEERTSALSQSLRVLLVVALIGILVGGVRLPSPAGDSTPAAEVAESRARKHLEVIASVPHAAGTPEAAEVREYLRSQLEALGIETEFIASTVEDVHPEWLYPANKPFQKDESEKRALVDVFARIPGRGDGGVLMIACHYDSVDRGPGHKGPGAGDDGAAAASMLELARAITEAEPLANDVWLLFTDGEELGLLGAELFCQDPERIAPIDVVFNFEGIGNNGPSIMFQTSQGNANLIDAFAQLDCAKVAPSFAQAIYERMPNDTDFTVFAHYGLIGLNFAIVGGRSAYHHAWDTPENLGGGTLQYQLDTMHALVQHFGEADLDALDSGEDHVYFDLLGRSFVHFGSAWNYVVLTLGLFAFARLWLHASRRGVRLLHGLLASGVMCLLPALKALLFVVALPALAAALVRLFGFEVTQRGDALSSFLVAWGALSMGFVALVSWAVHFGPKTESRTLEVLLGVSILWVLLAVLSFLWLPLGSYFATIPLLILTAVAPHLASRVELGRSSYLAALASVLILLLLAPSLGLIVSLVSTQTTVVVVLCTVGVCLGAPLCFPLAHWVRAQGRGASLLGWSLAAVILLAAGSFRAVGL